MNPTQPTTTLTLSQSKLQQTLTQLQPTLSKDSTRPALTRIHASLTPQGVLTLTTCDGYRATTIQLPCLSNDNIETIQFLFKSLKIDKVGKGKPDLCTLQITDTQLTLTDCNSYTFISNLETSTTYPDVSKFFEPKESTFEISFNPAYLADLGKQFKGEKVVKLSFTDNVNPMYITNDSGNVNALILPIRTNK